MPMQRRLRPYPVKHMQQTQGLHLLVSAGICGLTVPVKAANVAYPNTLSVVPTAMCAHLSYRPSQLDASIQVDDEVIANILPSVALYVPSPDVCGSEILPFASSGAMQDDLGDFSHDSGSLQIASTISSCNSLTLLRILLIMRTGNTKHHMQHKGEYLDDWAQPLLEINICHNF